MPQSLTVAACPFAGSADLEANRAIIETRLRDAMARGAALTLFHECALTGYPGEECPDLAHVTPDALEAALASIARLSDAEHACIVGAPAFGDGLPGNAAWFLHDGSVRAVYRKQTLFESEHAFFAEGDAPVMVELMGWKIGLLVCFDFRFPELMRPYLWAGCDLVAIPFSMGNRQAWKTEVARAHLISRAAENGLWVLSCNNAGIDQNAPTCLVSPEGRVTDELPPNSAQTLVAMIERADPPALTRQIRALALRLSASPD